jgi:serine O-acetyltransferase
MISAIDPDWKREAAGGSNPKRSVGLLLAIRAYQRPGNGIIDRARRKLNVIRHMAWSIISGADIPINTRIGGGLLLPHPNGVVIHPDCEIGPNCLIFQQVTLGNRNGVPKIGGHVDIGAGAKILGDIHIGDHARIGANAVVLIDVPSGATAVGNPARLIFPLTD